MSSFRRLLRLGSVASGLLVVASASASAQLDWAQCRPTPTPLGAPPLAYDSARGRVLALGSDSTRTTAAILEWDGATWTERTPSISPPGRSAYGLTFDSARGRLVLFSGVTGHFTPFADTWEWDGSQWTMAALTSARSSATFTYDAARGVSVLYGGITWAGPDSNETLTWNGSIWTRLTPAHQPRARIQSCAAYDSDRQRIVLFGGQDRTAPPAVTLGETWEWDGVDWTLVSSTGPSPRIGATMAYDSARRRTVLYGGSPDPTSTAYLTDTWEWDGSSWTPLVTLHAPSPTRDIGIAYDARSGRITAFDITRTYVLDLPPAISSVSPYDGSELGGDLVRLVGHGFTDATDTRITVGGAPASIVAASGSEWTVRTPPGSGDAEVRISNSLGSSAAASAFHYDPPAIAARLGTVNLANFSREDVVLVNGSAGDAARETSVVRGRPVSVYALTPSSRASSRFVLYAWIGIPNAASLASLPSGFGVMVFPPPFVAGAPQPQAIFNNVGRYRSLGRPTLPSTPAPSLVLAIPRFPRRAGDFALQGLIEDDASASGTGWSVTNAVVVHPQN